MGVREKQIADALKYESNMVLVNSLTKDYGKQYQKDLDIEIGHLNTMPIQFHASSVYEKYIITYYEKYAKWYFINKLLRYAKDDQENGPKNIWIFTSNMKRIRKQRKNGIAKKSVRNCWNRRWKTRMLTFGQQNAMVNAPYSENYGNGDRLRSVFGRNLSGIALYLFGDQFCIWLSGFCRYAVDE